MKIYALVSLAKALFEDKLEVTNTNISNGQVLVSHKSQGQEHRYW